MATNPTEIPQALLEDRVLIIGAGHFGQRAWRILRAAGKKVFILDKKGEAFEHEGGDYATGLCADGVSFLLENFPRLRPETIIVPALPLHLAFEWLKGYLAGTIHISKRDVPEDFLPSCPHRWKASEGSVLLSYSDFICPDDCPEQAYCTVTGQRRDKPLNAFIEESRLDGWKVVVIKSRQLAPGLGGYSAGDLAHLGGVVLKGSPGKWIAATACSCHGIATAFETELI